jgi:hypothetical protein
MAKDTTNVHKMAFLYRLAASLRLKECSLRAARSAALSILVTSGKPLRASIAAEFVFGESFITDCDWSEDV